MILTSDDSRSFSPNFITVVVNIGEKNIESSDVKFISLAPYPDVDHVTKIRSRLSITVLVKKKISQNYRLKK